MDAAAQTSPVDLWSDVKLMAGGRSITGTLRKGAELPGGKGLKAEKDENQAALRDTVCFYSFSLKTFPHCFLHTSALLDSCFRWQHRG